MGLIPVRVAVKWLLLRWVTISGHGKLSWYTTSTNVNSAFHPSDPVMIKFPDFSPTFPDILREHRQSIAPRNSSNRKKMHIFLSAILIYTDISMTTT